MMQMFQRDPRGEHLRVVDHIPEHDGSPAIYPHADLQAMSEIRDILKPFSEAERVRIMRDVVEFYDLPRPE